MNLDLLHRLLQALRPATDADGAAVLEDRELLERFAARRDQAAFELLLWRHGPMVLALCRRLLSHSQDVEDAFQATFLTLVGKGKSIARGEAVGGWLYRVAYRVALRARTERTKRSRRERPGVEALDVPARDEPSPDDLWGVLVREIDRLPGRERAAFVLCCLEGKTGAEAARQLGCPPGTVSSRLTGARKRLRARLLRRGLAPSFAALVLARPEDAGASSWPARVDTTLNAVQSFAARRAPGGALSGQAVALARGVSRAMFLSKLRFVGLMMLVTAALATGGILFRHGLEASPPAREGSAGTADPSSADGKGHAVRLVKPVPGGLDVTAEQPCTVQATEVGHIFPVVSGVLKGLTVDIGDGVRKGQVLAEIDAPLLELEEQQAAVAVRQAKAQVQEAESGVETSRAEIKAADSVILQRLADVEGARALVAVRTADVARADFLRKQNVLDAETADGKKATLHAAKAQADASAATLENARALLKIQQTKVTRAEAAVTTARANVEAAEVVLAKARYSRSLTRIVSPLDGVVTDRTVHNGEYVRGSDQGNGSPLLTVQRTDTVRVVVQIPGADVPLVRTGAPVDLNFGALPGIHFHDCTVSRTGFVQDPVSRCMRVQIDVPNPKQILRPGMSGEAAIHLHKGPATALRLPASCVVQSPDDQSTVYVVRDGKARRTAVQTGVERGGRVEILSGLKPSDAVVADPGELKGEIVPVEVQAGSEKRQ
jgi:RNA polymerase sigma factor (sigma-70 family)